LVEDQWLEVNWFSSWTDNLPEKELVREAKRAFGDQDLSEYLRLVPEIFRAFLKRVDGLNVPVNDAELPESMETLGVESALVEIAKKLLESSPEDPEIPSFESFKRVINGIAYYFIPPSVLSPYNPMCGMKDILDYANFHDQVSENINALSQFIDRLKGPEYLGKIELALVENPKDSNLLSQKKKIENALNENMQNLAIQNEEMERIENFFGTFKDSIVLIGPEEKTFQDLAPTPFDSAAVPKVSVHGNLIKTLTTGEFLHRLPIRVDHAATLLISILMAFLAVYQGNHASWVQAGGILLLLGYVFLSFETFAQSHVVWPISAPACAGLSTSFIGLAVMVVIEQKAKGKLKGMFGSYVSSDLVEQMVASGEEPSLGGEETSITAFFSDVQAFSSFSELLTPTGLVDLMNEYLTAMTNILQEERGTLDKYIGDAIVAMYGAPIPMKDHAYQAVRTSILMQQKQIELRKKWVPEIEKWGKCHGLVTQMQTRIGCNTGTATVGNMGALDRFNYTMMGDMVNLAARCESGAKAYGAYIMVTEETKLASEKTRDDIAFRYLDKIVVKGRSQPVAMYEPTGFMSELSQETQDCLDCFKQGIDRYLLQDWDGALSLFEKAKGMEPNKPGVTPGVKDNPSMILIDRCKVMKENPPGDDWDGVYVMTTK
jgi:class 3 adenylate cyclase